MFALAPHCLASPPSLVVGVQRIQGTMWNETFSDYLSQATNLTFSTRYYATDTDLMNDATAGELDFALTGPVLFVCLTLSGFTGDTVAEIVSKSSIDSSPVEKIAGAIVVPATSTIMGIEDLAGLDLLQQAGGVFLTPDISTILNDTLEGAAFTG
ncbi:hypothetical protein WJX84_005531 [Apatococcus fuscideae]|uniref:ABC transporter substrate-binding protein n=1 Tax=Apatococcus fuscideae TaxID=2026836 RepID=A0AAW1SVA1_9CHLO